jgi:hypothetical protein
VEVVDTGKNARWGDEKNKKIKSQPSLGCSPGFGLQVLAEQVLV